MRQSPASYENSAASKIRRIGPWRLATGYFVALLIAMFAAEALLGPTGLNWYQGRAGAGGVGVAFVIMWSYLTFVQLGRGNRWTVALPKAGLFSLALTIAAAAIIHLLGT